MTKAEAENKLEFLETIDEEKANGLRRIERRHFTKPDEMTLAKCFVNISLTLDAEVLQYFDSDSDKINEALREVMLHRKLSEQLLNDSVFVSRLREKLAA